MSDINDIVRLMRTGEKQAALDLINTAGIDVKGRDKFGNIPLIQAVIMGYPEIVAAFLAKGADANMQDDNGKTALMRAVQASEFESLKILLNNEKTDVNLQDDDGKTALMQAIEHNLPEFVDAILAKKQVDLEVQDEHGRTALMQAAGQGNPQIVDALIKKRADINARDRQGRTALIEAVSGKHVACLRLLLESGANPNVADKLGNKPLLMAIKKKDKEMVDLLLAYGVNPNTIDTAGRNAFDYAAEINHFAIIGSLLKYGALDDKNKSITDREKEEQNELFRDLFGNMNNNNQKISTLFNANDVRMAKAYLEAGEDINQMRDSKRRTLLMHYAEALNIEGVRFMLENGADVYAKDIYGRDALDWADSAQSKNFEQENFSNSKTAGRIISLIKYAIYAQRKVATAEKKIPALPLEKERD